MVHKAHTGQWRRCQHFVQDLLMCSKFMKHLKSLNRAKNTSRTKGPAFLEACVKFKACGPNVTHRYTLCGLRALQRCINVFKLVHASLMSVLTVNYISHNACGLCYLQNDRISPLGESGVQKYQLAEFTW